uniref:Secreted protein n=1 Tax=Caenorhabditis japonica TaxID=281687 RepID=A0A8R1EXP4_CAEJA
MMGCVIYLLVILVSYTIPSDSGPCSSCLEYANSSAAVPEVAPEGLIVDEDFDRILDVVGPSFRRTTAWSC